MSKKKNCTQCQEALEVSEKFCKHCGAAQPLESVVTAEKKKTYLFPLGLATGFLLSAVLLSGLFSSNEEETAPLPVEVPPVSEEIIEISAPVEEMDSLDIESLEQEEAVEEETPVEEEIPPETEPEPVTGIDMSGVSRTQVPVARAVASSVFPTWRNITYGAENTLDGDTGTAWVENASGIGVGEWLEHQFDSPQVVQEIQFYNGYGSAYTQNGVSSQVALSLSGGETFLYDVNGHWNTLVLPYPLESSSVRITILEAYSSEDQDTCISEMLVFNKSEEKPSTQLSQGSLAIYGDISGLSSSQASAFLEKIKEFEGGSTKTAYNEVLGNTVEVTTARLVDSGNGVPILILESYLQSDEDWFDYPYHVVDRVEIWQWDGEKAMKYQWQTKSSTGENGKVYRWGNVDFGGISEKDGAYFLNFYVPGGGDAPMYLTDVMLSLENGRVGQLAYDLSAYSCNQYLLEYTTIDTLCNDYKMYMSECPIQSQVDVSQMKPLVQEAMATQGDNYYVFIENGDTLLFPKANEWEPSPSIVYDTLYQVRSGGTFGHIMYLDGTVTSTITIKSILQNYI